MNPLRLFAAALLGTLGLAPGLASAVGTSAGTDIVNTASATYSVGSQTLAAPDATATVTVQELLNVDVTGGDTLAVNPGDDGDALNAVLAFTVTNTGNGVEDFELATEDTLAGDQFNPTVQTIYIDSNGNGTYDPGTDAEYILGTTTVTLDGNDPANDSIVVFVASTIPTDVSGTPLANGDEGLVQLTAVPSTAYAAAGNSFDLTNTAYDPGATVSDGSAPGIDAVTGASLDETDATAFAAQDTGTYVVSTVQVALSKTVTQIIDPFGNVQADLTRVLPGSRVSYRIEVTVTGSASANNLLVTDTLPTEMSYVAGTLRVNSTAESDDTGDGRGVVITDNGDGTNDATVTVNLGNQGATTAPIDIDFDAIVE